MAKIFLILSLILLSALSFAEEQAPKEIPQEEITDDLFKNLPKELRQQYEIPKDFFIPEDKTIHNESTPSENTNPTPPKQETKETHTPIQKAPKMMPPEDKSFIDKALDVLFGPGKKSRIPTADLNPSVIEEEKDAELIIEKIKEHKEQVKNISQLENLKSLEKVIENAVNNSPDVQKAKIEAEIIKRQNTFTPIPTFNIGNDFATGKTIISAGVQLPLEPLFTGKQREKYGELNIKQKQEETAQRCIEQYRTIISTAKKLEARKNKRKYIEQLVRNTQEQYSGGLIKLDELIKAQELQWQLEIDEQNYSIDLDTQIEKLKTIEHGGR